MATLEAKLPDHLQEKLSQNTISIKEVIKCTVIQLQDKLNISQEDAKLIIQEAANLIIGSLNYPNIVKLSTGCKSIDTITKGGISMRGINELHGCAGSGKTQLCLQLALMSQLPTKHGGFYKGAVYVCTEDRFPSKRLHELSQQFSKKYDIATKNFEDYIFVEHIGDYNQLLAFTSTRLEYLLTKVPIGIIIIDSIAGAFRSENENVDYIERSQHYYNIVERLNKYSRDYNVVILCTNQVTDNIEMQITEPCLGTSWRTLITSRYSITRTTDSIVRTFNIINAPDVASNTCKFIITNCGIEDVLEKSHNIK